MNLSLAIDWDDVLPKGQRIFYQKDWNIYKEKYGIPFARGTIANMLSKGIGPKSFMLAGRRVFHREDIVVFLNNVTMKSSVEV